MITGAFGTSGWTVIAWPSVRPLLTESLNGEVRYDGGNDGR